MTFPKRGQPAYPGDGFSGVAPGSVLPRWREMRRWVISGIVAVVRGSALAGCQTNAPAFGVDAPSATIRADAIPKVSGLPAGTPATVSGGLLSAAGVASAGGVMTLAASLFPGQVNSLTVEAVVGSRLSTVSVKVTQSMSTADDHGAMSCRIVGPHAPIAGATIRYGQVAAQSASDGTFSLTGLPAGQIVAVITAPGYSPGVIAASVSNGGTAAADETRLTPLPPETIVGPAAPDHLSYLLRAQPQCSLVIGSPWAVLGPPGTSQALCGLPEAAVYELVASDLGRRSGHWDGRGQLYLKDCDGAPYDQGECFPATLVIMGASSGYCLPPAQREPGCGGGV